VPLKYTKTSVREKLKKKAGWISKQLNHFMQFHPLPTPRKYENSETHLFLGRQYRLRIRKAQKPEVKLIGAFFDMELPDPTNRKRAEKLILDWYKVHAKKVTRKRFLQYLPAVKKIGISDPEIRVRKMKRRWGSCSGNKITFNTELVKTPIHCLDYVIVHEMCHLVYPNHSKEFYRLLRRIMPDFEKRKERLNRFII
jgi:predicted metal-dependent hydrolase